MGLRSVLESSDGGRGSGKGRQSEGGRVAERVTEEK